MERNWYALYVSSRHEKKLSRLLIDKGIESYVPLVKTMRQWSDRKKLVEFPLISGYVFVNINEVEMEKTLQTRGAVQFVRYLGKPAIIRKIEIENLKNLVALGYHLSAYKADSIKRGDKIKVVSGPLKNLEGSIIQELDGTFFEVSLNEIGFNIKAKLPADVIHQIQGS